MRRLVLAAALALAAVPAVAQQPERLPDFDPFTYTCSDLLQDAAAAEAAPLSARGVRLISAVAFGQGYLYGFLDARAQPLRYSVGSLQGPFRQVVDFCRERPQLHYHDGLSGLAPRLSRPARVE
jgi:hypothetical protein